MQRGGIARHFFGGRGGDFNEQSGAVERILMRGQIDGPERSGGVNGGVDARAEIGMALAEAVARIGNGSWGEPVVLALPGVGGETEAGAARVELLKIDGQAVDMKGAERREEFGAFGGVAAERRDGDSAASGLFF